jgi:hypothetical protein
MLTICWCFIHLNNCMGALISIRWAQLRRLSATLAWWHYLALMLIAFFVFLTFAQLYRDADRVWVATILIATSVFFIHSHRKDKRFLKIVLTRPYKAYFLEYSLVVLPVLILSLSTTYWYHFLITLALILGISFLELTPTKKVRYAGMSKFFPPDNFEWIGGVRANFYAILFLYGTCIVGILLPYGSLVMLGILHTILPKFYEECEPLQLLHFQMNDKSINEFLRKKIWTHSLVFCKYTLIFIVPYLILHTDTFWATLFVYYYCYKNFVFFILQKYSSYAPNRVLHQNNLLVSMVIMSILIPFFWILPEFMIWRHWRVAKRNLTFYKC